VLVDAGGSSLLATSMSMAATNGVCWGYRSALVSVVSHFLELDADLEVHVYERNVGLTEDKVDALWSRVRAVTISLASHVPPSVARNPPDSAGT
jgi:hypothetical protein